MTVETVKTVIRRFLSSDVPAVLALKGSWGVGKTFAWNKLVHETKDTLAPANYAYVSLFGVGTLAELRLAIFANAQPAKLIGQKIDATTVNNEWLALSWSRLKSLMAFLSNKDAPYLRQVSIGLDAIAPHLIRNTVICLDDFERLSSNVEPDQLLGFISGLKEEKGCKVALIFNEDKLDDKKKHYKKYREKVVDIELLFEPTADEAAELAFPEDLPFRDDVKRHAVSLDIKNIRVLRRIVDGLRLIYTEVKDLHEGVMRRAVNTLALAATTYYAPSAKIPPLEFIRNWDRFSWGYKKAAGKEVDPHEAQWNAVLEAYGLTDVDEFDLAIFNVIERGYVEESGLKHAALALDAQFRAGELEGKFSAAWNLFHDTFENNANELIEQLTENLKKSVQYVTPINLNGTTQLLRELGRDDLANELINYYVNARSGDAKLFDLTELGFGPKINDPYLRKRFGEQIAQMQNAPSLAEAARRIAELSSWPALELAVLKEASEDEFYKLFKSAHGPKLNEIVKACLNFEGLDEHKEIGKKARAALARIGKESLLNALRVKRYGVALEGSDEGNEKQA